MKKLRFNLFIYLLAGVTVYSACRKTDQPANPPDLPGNEEQFFTRHASNDPLVQFLTHKMQRENKQQPFISTIISRIGYPRWDKSVVAGGESVRTSGRGNTLGDSVNIVYIPFVRDSQNYVNASLLFKVSPTDTSYQYLLDWQYADYGFDTTGEGWNAKDVFHVFANFDRTVFDRTAFEITDDRLYGTPDAGEKVVVKLRPAAPSGQRSNILVPFTVCSVEDVCYGPAWYNTWCNGECNTSCEFYTHTETSCFTYWIEDGWTPAGGGQTGGQTGGGSTGGSGGYPPPQCPGVAARNGVLPGNCQTGWIPPEGPGGGATPPEPIDSMLARYARGIDKTADSIFQLSMNSAVKEEWGFPIVQKSGNVYAKRCTTNHYTDIVVLDRYIETGEKIVGECHTHPDSSANPLARSAPSGADLETFNINSRLGYTVIVECGNVRYALVIEDVSLCRTFFSLHNSEELMYQQEVIAMQQSGWQTNWQHATEVALIQLLGQASSCGIGFYKSTTTKTNFIKLN